MRTSKKFALIITIICIAVLALLILQNIRPSDLLKVPQDYPTIQEAINQAVPGSKILVSPGIYEEHLFINKSISIIGENKSTTIIDASGTGIGVRVTADYVNISRFTIRNADPPRYGLYIHSSSHCMFSENIVTRNGRGIYAFNCERITIKANLVTGNSFGISLVRSANNRLRNNSLYANDYNLDVSGLSLAQYIQDIDVSNTADDKPIYYWVNKESSQVPSDAGYVAIVNSTNIVARDLSLSKNYQGLLLAHTSSCTIQNITLSKNFDGIQLFNSHHNVIINNTMTGHRGSAISLGFYSSNNIISKNWILLNRSPVFNETTDGVRLAHYATANKIINNTVSENTNGIRALLSSDNIIYHNDFINNTLREYGYWSINSWDNGYPSGGNYWSDFEERYPTVEDVYSGPNQDQPGSDGIWDHPYVIDGNQDNYPLMNPYNPIS